MSTKAPELHSAERSSPLPASKGRLFGQDQRVYEAVFDAVLSHRLPPGTKLVESVLSETLALPRAVIRMGLLRLAHDHIVELRPNRGAAVASPSLQDARDVYDARRIIEGAIAERLAGSMTPEQLKALRLIVMQGTKAFERGDTLAWIVLAGRFHLELAHCAGNPVLHEQLRALVSRSNLITGLYLHPGNTRFSSDERLDLLEQLAHDTPGAKRIARRIMEQLLLGVEQRLRVLPARDASVDVGELLRVSQSRASPKTRDAA